MPEELRNKLVIAQRNAQEYFIDSLRWRETFTDVINHYQVNGIRREHILLLIQTIYEKCTSKKDSLTVRLHQYLCIT